MYITQMQLHEFGGINMGFCSKESETDDDP